MVLDGFGEVRHDSACCRGTVEVSGCWRPCHHLYKTRIPASRLYKKKVCRNQNTSECLRCGDLRVPKQTKIPKPFCQDLGQCVSKSGANPTFAISLAAMVASLFRAFLLLAAIWSSMAALPRLQDDTTCMTEEDQWLVSFDIH